jgi:hypothetical protein
MSLSIDMGMVGMCDQKTSDDICQPDLKPEIVDSLAERIDRTPREYASSSREEANELRTV